MKGLDAIQVVLDWIGVSKDRTHDVKLVELSKDVASLKSNGANSNAGTFLTADPLEIRRQRRREKNQLLRTLATAEKPSVQKLLEQEIADFDDETEEMIADAENKARKAEEARIDAQAKAEKKEAEAKAKAEKKEAEEKTIRMIGALAIFGMIAILFLVVFTPISFKDILIGVPACIVGYAIWDWKKNKKEEKKS
ncbi:MAG: hypothetical protein ABIG90_01650 [bacterium]